MQASSSLAAVPVLSDVDVAMLSRIGITSVGDLRAFGAVEVYGRLKRSGAAAGLPLLYALEAGARGSNITNISAARRAELFAVFAGHHAQMPLAESANPGETVAEEVPLLQSECISLSRTWPTGRLS